MKKILPFWILTMLLLAGGGTWAQVELLPNTPNDTYFCAAHPVPGIVYLAGDQAVYKSYDNGDSWGTVFAFDSSFSSRFFGMWFRDEQTGFATCAKNGKSAAALMTSDLLDATLLIKPWTAECRGNALTQPMPSRMSSLSAKTSCLH